MRSFYALLGAAAVIAALAFAGCGETVVDATKTEEALAANLSKSLNEKIAAVDCPSDIEVEKGNTFNCSVDVQKGEDQTVTLRILNEDADINVTDIRGSNE
jgi:NAD(P)H-hydrate repair Nnr-like enzyme with NAD(P)H-hydrate epimerase domain